jgi:predicted LPLAT superfamily acyltransferase
MEAQHREQVIISGPRYAARLGHYCLRAPRTMVQLLPFLEDR